MDSDQKTLNMTTVGADTLARAGRARITSIQGLGIASSTIIFYDSADASSPGTAVAWVIIEVATPCVVVAVIVGIAAPETTG